MIDMNNLHRNRKISDEIIHVPRRIDLRPIDNKIKYKQAVAEKADRTAYCVRRIN